MTTLLNLALLCYLANKIEFLDEYACLDSVEKGGGEEGGVSGNFTKNEERTFTLFFFCSRRVHSNGFGRIHNGTIKVIDACRFSLSKELRAWKKNIVTGRANGNTPCASEEEYKSRGKGSRCEKGCPRTKEYFDLYV